MDPDADKRDFSVLARRSGAPLTEDDITRLYEGYGMLRRIVAELDLAPPLETDTRPASRSGDC